MRVTQSMLSNNMLRNLNSSYNNMSKLQEQINSGKKITRPSDDPVVAIKGMQYRTDLGKIEQFTRNLDEAHSWLDTTDEALDQAGTMLHRVKELVVQASNDTNNTDDRQKIETEMAQIREQFRDIANSKVGDKYIFSGTNTSQPLFKSTAPLPATLDVDGKIVVEDETMQGPGVREERQIELYEGIKLGINSSNGKDIFAQIDQLMGTVSHVLNTQKVPTVAGVNEPVAEPTHDDIQSLLSQVELQLSNVLTERANIGAKQNRAELLGNRLSTQEVNVTKQMSNNEDTDYAKAITEMTTAEAIHQASLSVGSKIIKQTLVDFL